MKKILSIIALLLLCLGTALDFSQRGFQLLHLPSLATAGILGYLTVAEKRK